MAKSSKTNARQTSPKVARMASKALRDGRSGFCRPRSVSGFQSSQLRCVSPCGRCSR